MPEPDPTLHSTTHDSSETASQQEGLAEWEKMQYKVCSALSFEPHAYGPKHITTRYFLIKIFFTKTFRRWVNYHLGKRGLKVERLEKDFRDGLLLINLLEEITGKELGKNTLSKKTVEYSKLDALNVAFNFMRNSCHLNLTNCGPEGLISLSLLFHHFPHS